MMSPLHPEVAQQELQYFVNPSFDSDITDEGDVREGDVQKAGMVNQKILKKVNDIYWGNRISAGQEEPIGRRLTKKENRGESSNSPSNYKAKTPEDPLRGRSASSFSSRDPSPVRMEFNNDMADFFDHSNEEETSTDRDLTNVKELQELTTLNERLEQKVENTRE